MNIQWTISIEEYRDSSKEALRNIEAIFEEYDLNFQMYHYGCYNWTLDEDIGTFLRTNYESLKRINIVLENDLTITFHDLARYNLNLVLKSSAIEIIADLFIRVEFRESKQTKISLYDYVTKEKKKTEPEGGLNS